MGVDVEVIGWGSETAGLPAGAGGTLLTTAHAPGNKVARNATSWGGAALTRTCAARAGVRAGGAGAMIGEDSVLGADAGILSGGGSRVGGVQRA